MKQLWKYMFEFVLGIILLATGLSAFTLLSLCLQKISNPQMKNMSGRETVLLGLIAFIFIIIDIVIVRRWIKKAYSN